MKKTYEDDYEHPITATRKDIGLTVRVRKMEKSEMPDDGITYYADTECVIYREDELQASLKDGENQLGEKS